MFNHLLIILLLILVSGCGTIKTLDPAFNHVKIEYKSKKSYCDSIPRVYSGVAYNFCILHGDPRSGADSVESAGLIPFVLFDFIFSAVGDTVLLPYTIYAQISEGPIRVN